MLSVGLRLKELREGKNLSQGDIEKKSGLLRCYLSRCENGHTVPSIDTLQKWTRAMDVPLYQVFYAGTDPETPALPKKTVQKIPTKLQRESEEIARLFANIKRAEDRDLVAHMVRKLARHAA
jgi:transcriptional regulator with XRE-family HTH domain